MTDNNKKEEHLEQIEWYPDPELERIFNLATERAWPKPNSPSSSLNPE